MKKHYCLKPIETPECNAVFGAPQGFEDQVKPLHLERTEEGLFSTWKIDDPEALKLLMKTGEIKLFIMGQNMPPVNLFMEIE